MVGVKNIILWSGGKDSTATVILAKEHGIKIDAILFSEVMFDKNISGELPEHIAFVKNKAIPTFEKWGFKYVDSLKAFNESVGLQTFHLYEILLK